MGELGNTGTGKLPEGKKSICIFLFIRPIPRSYCPLYVQRAPKGSRSAQMPVREYPRFCEKQHFYIREASAGSNREYNSLFGVDFKYLEEIE